VATVAAGVASGGAWPARAGVLSVLLLLVPLATPARAAERIVSVGGTVTEIVYALGAGDALVGADTSSVYPPEAEKLPKVGYQRTLSAEGVLSLSPTLILITPESGPPAAIEQLRGTGARVVPIPTGTDVEAARAAIRAVATTLDRQARGEDLVKALEADVEQARALAAASSSHPRVLFVYARGAGMAMVSGKGTAADEMIRLAGAVNAVNDYEGFRPLTAEGVVAAAPDVVLVPSRGLDSLGGKAGLLAQPGMSLTPAARAERVVAMDDLYLLGFGPRTGQALADLARALHQQQRGDIGVDSGVRRDAPLWFAAIQSGASRRTPDRSKAVATNAGAAR